MGNYVIFTESTSDLPVNIIKEFDIKVIPMTFSIDDKSYLNYPDHRELDVQEFYEKLRNGGKSTTTLVNYMTFIEYFEPELMAGNDILYLGFSSGLSGTYESSLIAKEQLEEKYKGSKIICIDTKCASLGEGLIVYTAALKRKEGLAIEELQKWVTDSHLNLCHWVTVDDLNHLKRGGRVNAVTATLGTMLNVKPMIHVDDDGHLIPVTNVRGRKKSLHALLEKMEETGIDPENQTVFIGHGDSLEDAEYLAKIIKENLNVRDIVINYIGPVIGSHSGPGTIALFFYGALR